MTWQTVYTNVPARIWLCLCLWLGSTAGWAQTPVSFAKVLRLQGVVTATPGGSEAGRTLQLGDRVVVGERIEASATGEALLQTDDGGYVAVRPSAAWVMEQYSADSKTSGRWSLQLLSGGLRLVTGWIGRLHPANYRVTTARATIGIRGTDHEPYYVPETLAMVLAQPPGTYDKVNRGGTTLEAGGQRVDIDPGKVGFARLPVKTRALLTLALPVILDKVPDFYVPGPFDAELDQLSAAAQAPAVLAAKVCAATPVAKAWLAQLDRAMQRRDSAAVMALFAEDVQIEVTVKDGTGADTTLALGREEFARSASVALLGLRNYRQRRLSLSAQPVQAGVCEAVSLQSVVLEQGQLNDKPYRFESVEAYEIVLRAGRWVATQAFTRQR